MRLRSSVAPNRAYRLDMRQAISSSFDIWRRKFSFSQSICLGWFGNQVVYPNNLIKPFELKLWMTFVTKDTVNFRVQLFLIGGPALIGEKYDTVVRIDDDDSRHVTNIRRIDYCKAKNLNIPGSL